MSLLFFIYSVITIAVFMGNVLEYEELYKSLIYSLFWPIFFIILVIILIKKSFKVFGEFWRNNL